jgi:uncharacterized protein (DUF2147 family)
MKKLNAILVFIFSVFFVQSVFAASGIEGRWTTIDDKTGKKRAVVQISVSGNTLSGTIIETYKQPGDTGICDNCPGAFKGKPVKGLRFVWGLQQQGNPNEWAGGKILDPRTGKIYNAKMTLKGNQLEVRGFLGVSLLGRTQTWVR